MSAGQSEFVAARCACGWESEPVPVRADSPNGEWFARQKAAIEYRSHFDTTHRPQRPLPTYVTAYSGSRGGSDG